MAVEESEAPAAAEAAAGAEAAPVALDDVGHRFLAHREQIQPEQDGPQAVFLPYMVGTGAEAFFSAQRGLAGIQQVAEELPSGRGFEHFDAEALGDTVGSL